MSRSKFKIIAGLGNPGDTYARTRHNIGFAVIDEIADQFHLTIDQTKFDSLYVKTRLKGHDLFLIKPMSYMNRSGIPLSKFASYFKVSMEDVIVVHDDMDLSFGQIRLAKNRGHGGHNGVRSIIESFGRKDCIRVRLGVGHPQGQKAVTSHVLGGFTPDEKICMDKTIDTASQACLAILENGLTRAMNSFNTKS